MAMEIGHRNMTFHRVGCSVICNELYEGLRDNYMYYKLKPHLSVSTSMPCPYREAATN